MVIIILTNQLTLTLAILILILQSNVLTNSYFSPYPNYSFKSFDPPWRPRKSFITLTRSRRSFGEGRDGAGNGGKFGGRPWGSREAMARRCGLGGAPAGAGRHGGDCCALATETEREGRDWPRAYIRLCRTLDGGAPLPRHDVWRVTAAP